MVLNKAIILGGGSSIRQNQWNVPIKQLPLWSYLREEFVLGTNFSELFFPSTALVFQDYKMYHSQKEWMDYVPLLVGRLDSYYFSERCTVGRGNNLILTKDLYWQLSGMAALSLAIKMGVKNVFLLGFDACDIGGHTHFYDDTKIGTYVYQNKEQCGVGRHSSGILKGLYKTQQYRPEEGKIKELNEIWMAPFKEDLKRGVNIVNVSPESKIDTFPKWSYKQFYSYLDENVELYNQEELREQIRCLLSQ